MIVCESLVYAFVTAPGAVADSPLDKLQLAIGRPTYRMYPVKRPQSTILPALTYLRVAATRAEGLTEAGRLVDVRLQIDAWAPTYAQVKELAANVRLVLNGYALGPRNGLRAIHFLVDQDITDENPNIFHVAADYSIWVEED